MSAKATATKILTATALILAAVIGLASTVSAAEYVGTGRITILESLAVSEEQSVDFGYVHRPSAGTNTLSLNHADGSVTASGAGDAQVVGGTSTSGVYTISGQPDRAIQVSVAVTDFSDPGISVDEAYVNGPTDSVSGKLDSAGKYEAKVGGAVTIDSNASLGTHTTDVIMTVTYE
ncbi:DUF4402 domain-containing protein [Persicimonas caeni]|nr:DUF4402 domain-containing protein [Persicimonas caeni]